jgi:hypothetical protein
MNMFFGCFAARASGAEADRLFADVVERSPFQLWGPGDPIPRHAVRLLIGVAPSSGFDMRLLDVMVEAMACGPSALPTVDVFNTAHCQHLEDFRRYIPSLGEIFHTPVAGIWFGGQLTWFGQGHAARDQIARMFGSTSDRIVEYVQQRTQTRTRTQEAKT